MLITGDAEFAVRKTSRSEVRGTRKSVDDIGVFDLREYYDVPECPKPGRKGLCTTGATWAAILYLMLQEFRDELDWDLVVQIQKREACLPE